VETLGDVTPAEISSLGAHRKRQEIKARYDNMIAEFERQCHMGMTLLQMELKVRIAVAQSNMARELNDLEPLK